MLDVSNFSFKCLNLLSRMKKCIDWIPLKRSKSSKVSCSSKLLPIIFFIIDVIWHHLLLCYIIIYNIMYGYYISHILINFKVILLSNLRIVYNISTQLTYVNDSCYYLGQTRYLLWLPWSIISSFLNFCFRLHTW